MMTTGRPKPKADELHKRILEYCQTLACRWIATTWTAFSVKPSESIFHTWNWSECLLAGPAQRRRERSTELRIQNAKFREPATLEAFDWAFNAQFIDRVQMEELATGDFIRRRDNLVFVGQSGLGKSHLIQAIGRRCCAVGYRVRYITSADLLRELGTSLADGTMPKRLRYFAGFELLIIDELGLDKLEREEYPLAPSLLHKVIDSRSRKRSTALVTNIDFEAWGQYLGDPPDSDGAARSGRGWSDHSQVSGQVLSSQPRSACQAIGDGYDNQAATDLN